MTNFAMWLASIFGPLLLIIGLWKLMNAQSMMKAMGALKNTPGILYYSSVAYLWVGLTILSQYSVWNWTGFVLVTLLGWVLIIRGIMGLFAPRMLLDMLMGHPRYTKLCGIIPLVWGLALSWVGYMM
jgi:hypothetical protein